MTSLPGDIEIELEDRGRSLREAKKVSRWQALGAAVFITALWAALDRITGRHTDLITTFFAAFGGATVLSMFVLPSPAQRSSIPNHPEGGK